MGVCRKPTIKQKPRETVNAMVAKPSTLWETATEIRKLQHNYDDTL